MREAMTIGRLADAAGVGVETVRYYQRRGLIKEPRKPPGGQRRYAPEVLAQLGFIRRAQELGFTLDEIKRLQQLQPRQCAQVRALVEEKLQLLEARIRQLQGMRTKLTRMGSLCDGVKPGASCPFLHALSEEESPAQEGGRSRRAS